jgi:hypothetical protein
MIEDSLTEASGPTALLIADSLRIEDKERDTQDREPRLTPASVHDRLARVLSEFLTQAAISNAVGPEASIKLSSVLSPQHR